MEGFGAYILGRNMFGPPGDDWGGPDWKGWWGDNPPFHAPTFILTHQARAPIVMDGRTTFHFVTGGIEAALAEAKSTAANPDAAVFRPFASTCSQEQSANCTWRCHPSFWAVVNCCSQASTCRLSGTR